MSHTEHRARGTGMPPTSDPLRGADNQRHPHRGHRHGRRGHRVAARSRRARRDRQDASCATSRPRSRLWIERQVAADDARILITTGGTGITARDGTFEVASAIIEKPLPGFGELFRMLSYQEIGAAAMLSRACAGRVGRAILVCLPGSEARGAPGGREAAAAGARTPRAGSDAVTMRPFADTITLDEARRLIGGGDRAVTRHETIALDKADGRVLAEDVVAPMDQPPFDRSAMDGYAVRAADVAGATRGVPTVLRLIGRAYTAEPFAGTLAPGDCVEIATGAPIPDGADAVVMVEDTGRPGPRTGRRRPGSIRASRCWCWSRRAGQHVIRRGSDMRAGDVVLRAGQALTPSRIGALAAIGRDQVQVFGKPIVAIFPTGNEVVRQGQPLPLASVYDVNSFTVAALVARHGGVAERHAPVPDTIEATTTALDAAAGADIVVLGGGSSVGERDVVIDAVAARGEVIFHGIAVKPGKPTLFARIALPLRASAGVRDARQPDVVPVARRTCCWCRRCGSWPGCRRSIRRGSGVAWRARSAHPRTGISSCRCGSRATWRVPTFKGSGEITSLSQADGYVEIPVGVARLDAGSDVEVVGYE